MEVLGNQDENLESSTEGKAACDKKMTKEAKESENPSSPIVLDESSSTTKPKDEPAEPTPEPSMTGEQKSKNRKNRKKSECNVQHVLRALNSLSTPEEKLAAMCQKYADLFDENRKLQSNAKRMEKQLTAATKERDQFRTDLSKSVLSRGRLENLCRELQRQNKEVKEESFQKMREEEEKRKEVSAKFQTTLNEITELMKEDNDKTMKLRDDNIDMTSKLKSIYEQYGIREQQIEKMAKQMALEAQLYEARFAKMEMESSAEKEVLLREKQQLLVTLTEYQAKFQEYQNIEVALRNQVALYNSKYEEFEKSLTRSNKMFTGFKDEMESMTHKIVKLESETLAWRQRWEKTQKALVSMAAEKQKSDQEVVMAAKQMSTLHKLCRTLQVERAQLLSKLKELGSAPDADKFETAIENVFAENGINDANVPETSTEGKESEPVEQRCNKKKSRHAKTPQKTNSFPVNDSGETLTTLLVDSQSPLPDISNLSLGTAVLSNPNITETSSPSASNSLVNGQLNGDLVHSETEESIDPKVEQSPPQKDSESDNSLLNKPAENLKLNKTSPKKRNKK